MPLVNNPIIGELMQGNRLDEIFDLFNRVNNFLCFFFLF